MSFKEWYLFAAVVAVSLWDVFIWRKWVSHWRMSGEREVPVGVYIFSCLMANGLMAAFIYYG